MSQVFHCRNGHHWDVANAATGPAPFSVCPHCGESGWHGDSLATPPLPGRQHHAFPDTQVPTLVAHATREPATPTAIPGHEIVQELGRGGMGIVYQARQTHLNRTVALKFILLGRHARAGDRLRFLTEANAVARLEHPNIVRLYEAGDADDGPYFTLEFVAGGSLDRKLRTATLPPTEAAVLVAQLARAMQHAHEQGILHRDLKPSNILLAEDGTPKIADFGLAKNFGDSLALTHTGDIIGTPCYMAPEQAAGKREVGPAADLHALGAVLYECLTGRPPYLGATPADTMRQVQHDDPVSPRRVQPDVPRDLETICLKCLRKEPTRRYDSGSALADDLQRFVEGRPILARRTSALEHGWRWCRRNRLAATLLAALFFAVVSGVGGVTWKWLDAERQRERAETAERSERARAEAEKQARLESQKLAADGAAMSVALMKAQETRLKNGALQVSFGEPVKAAEQFQLACDLLQALPANFRNEPHRLALVKGHAYLAVLQLKNQKPDLALTNLRLAASELPRLPLDAAEIAKDRSGFGSVCFVLGMALFTARHAAEAVEPMRRAVAHFEQAFLENPKRSERRRALSHAMFNFGEVQRQAGRVAAAAATALQREKLWPDYPDEIHDVACELGRCMKTIGQGKSPLTPAEEAERRRYGDQAIAVLKRAVAVGLEGLSTLPKDDDFALLRERPDFQALVRSASK